MSERIPTVETFEPIHPKKVKAKSSDNLIHTRSFTGVFRTLRVGGAGLLFLAFFGTVWLNWGGRQAVLWDLAESKFHIFGATFWPQDFILLSALLIICAFGLFAITVFAGRVWCGYTCPQSSFTWLFMWCEKVTEGERNQRIKLQAAPWSLNKLARRSAKHTLWLGISVLTGLTFVGYFTPIRPLAAELLTWQMGGVSLFWVLFFTGATYINAGWLREAVCMHMCPYARFQSVMFDKDTLTISYDAARGEHRGPRKRDVPPAQVGLGDCIDCQLCVQVCPTGIDIRDGLQMECIGCAACIDACDSIMDKMGYARGLVSYTSEHQLQGGKTHLLRPRLIGYSAVLVVMLAALVVALIERPMVSLDVTKDRGMFRENSLGLIENIYSLKVINKTQQRQEYRLELVDAEGFQLQGKTQVSLAAGEIVDIPVSVALLADTPASSSQTLRFKVTDVDEPWIYTAADSRFVAPLNR
ncbi:MAG: cytochrome c oxidase accessory protein CcoG [Pseudomonadales bacterium RIFCSPLOWO2_12_60_38]|uniref:cytochrome c oxidase accessory protein CcoG n=1 Tax=Pseudomonas TaxID=286 RepID=UPI000518B486|nr:MULTISPECIES: cytochrome c oxidase accessory protein CcoG [unclassified Pseudomonas]MBH3400887.1 cytochrome c oxidase accessory protein CcoG [Pseudomonas fluorescens]NLT88226.1 cytochrome c oxidase accessory protein CcoG [Pseudomonas lactis]OHC32311.1 MAG: cytochrome c oxidase accessory protein CcoG [Pseudomonadales bacterium RIFCSPLOWO2_12_60_38]OHC38379.1 MAG: cytochrome c oxidase accessory protein CcoG [Pseudomonadales bacterium RIFCSPLOWO2_12_FULL_59_450]MBS6084297.1 cytochrome c oxidas